jgi:hypothetical protein
MNKTNIILILLLFVTFSCGKEDALSKTDLLTQAPWILKASVYDPSYPTEQGSIVNRYAILPNYIKDDLFYYYPSGTYANMEGETKLSVYDYDVWEVGVWAFNQDETKLYKGIIYYMDEYEILKLDGSELQLKLMIYDTLDNAYSLTETFKHP